MNASRVFFVSFACFAVTTCLATPALAQAILLPTVHYGTPLRVAAGVGVYVPTHEEGGFRGRGFIGDAGVGQGGVRASFGCASFLENFGLDLRGVFTRTWKSPRVAPAESTYAGAEAGVTIGYVHASVGVARRLAGPPGSHATLFTWTAGLHVPIKTR